jgi:hypothetical protein
MVKPKAGDPPPVAPQPSPAQIAAQSKMQSEQAKVKMAELKLQSEQLKLEQLKLELQFEIVKMKADHQPDFEEMAQKLKETTHKHELENRRLALEEERLNHQINQDVTNGSHKRRIEDGKLALDVTSQMFGRMDKNEN